MDRALPVLRGRIYIPSPARQIRTPRLVPRSELPLLQQFPLYRPEQPRSREILLPRPSCRLPTAFGQSGLPVERSDSLRATPTNIQPRDLFLRAMTSIVQL